MHLYPNILFEDSHVLVVEKPAGMPSQMTPDGRPGAEDLLRAMIETRDHKPGKAYLHVVHRLDGAVSGILLLAKSSKALSRLSEQVREHTMKKTYLGIVEGKSSFVEKELLVDYIDHGANKAIAKSLEKGGKKAELRILKSILLPNNSSLIAVELLTGRYHQIRFQLSRRGYPLIGDTSYGSSRTYQKGKIQLHHSILTFTHPTLKKEMTILSTPPWTSLQSPLTQVLQDLAHPTQA